MTFTKLTMGLLAVIMMNCQNNTGSEDSQNDRVTDDISLENNEFIYWINSYKSYCIGVAPQMCLQIQKGKNKKSGAWQMFYSNINDFEWEPGFIYQIIVRENQIPHSQVPADASDIKYTLVRLVDKQRDPTIRLHDIWALESIQGKSFDEFKPEERPTLEIKLSMGQIMGTDGCNHYNGKIEQVDERILRFSTLATTRKACQYMDLSALFHQQIEKVDAYFLDELILTLNDKDGNELMTFRKVD